MASFTIENWNESQWVNYWQYTYTYDPSGNRTLVFFERWDGSNWNNSTKAAARKSNFNDLS